MSKRNVLMLALPLLFAACDASPPLTPESDAMLEPGGLFRSKQGGLFRIEAPNFPYYSRTEPPSETGGYGYRTDEWAAITFYRDPGCIPPGFNLFEFYDIPGAFFCDSRVGGFALFTEPLGMTPPKHTNLHGNAVPIWFVPWNGPFRQAVEDGSLTVGQLEAMPGLLKGVATQFHEILHTIEAHPVPKINLSARGILLPESGGGSFRYNVNWPGLTVSDIKNVKIQIQR